MGLPLDSVFDLGKTVIERIWPDPNKRAEEMRKLEQLRHDGDIARIDAHVKLLVGQIDVNKIEASHKSIFVAGWRPFVGWTCGIILAYNYIGVSLIEYAWLFTDLAQSENPPPLPERMSMSELFPVLLGLLGIGGMRSLDKFNRVQTDKI